MALTTWSAFVTAHPEKANSCTQTLLVAKGIGQNQVYLLEVDPLTGEIPTSGGGGVSTDMNVAATAISLTAVYGSTYLVDTTTQVTITCPTPVANKWFEVKDAIGTGASTNNIAIGRAGTEKIDNVAAAFSMSSNRQSIKVVSDGTDWFIV